MRYDDPTLRPAMDLEGVKRWLPADKQGYATLTEAMRRAGLPRVTTRRCEAGTLELGAGLEVLVSASLATLRDGDLLDVVVDSRSSSLELPAWARRAGHEVVDERRDGESYVVTLRAASTELTP